MNLLLLSSKRKTDYTYSLHLLQDMSAKFLEDCTTYRLHEDEQICWKGDA